MERKNCWEFMKCGRESTAGDVDKPDICPASVSGEYDGANKGKSRGRCCWAVAGTYCGGAIQGTYAKKLMDCFHCEFLKHVNEQEGREFQLTPKDLSGER